MKNNSVTTSTSALKLGTPTLATGMRNLDHVRLFFESFFTATTSLKDQNKFLFLFLHEYVTQNNTDTINKILSDNAFKDLHPSLLKSALIITENVPGVEQSREKVMSIFNEKMQA